MNYYLDFEATRFSQRIISIGCVADNGESFKTLVQPVAKGKVDRFITELTGITNEMLAEAPNADEAFNQLFDFIELNSDGKAPRYYCYGDSDAAFIHNTLKYMKEPRACILAQALRYNIIDYSLIVKNFFNSSNDIALRKVYMLMRHETELVQAHDALEDAKMLMYVAKRLYSNCRENDLQIINTIPSQRPPVSKKKAPATFNSWNGQSKWEANTWANENNYKIKAIDQHDSNKIKYFNDMEVAALWLIKYTIHNVSPKDGQYIAKIKRNITKGIINRQCKYNCYWQANKEKK